jgi:hypothetical protein
MFLQNVCRSARVLLVAVALLVPISQALASTCDASSQDWVKKNLPILPSSLKEFSAVPAEHSRAVFRMLPARVKSQLWREKLTTYLQATDGLSAEQKQAIQDAARLASPEFFRASENAMTHLRVDIHLPTEALRVRFVSLFGEGEARNLLERLDASASSYSLDDEPGGETIECSCSTDSSFCGSGYSCRGGSCGTASGCGAFWQYTCNGLCKSGTGGKTP